jgi:predicted ATPase
MIGTHNVIVQNRRVQYKFTVSRNITILRGDSATGKTKMIEMIAAYQQNGEQSGVNIACDKNCVVLSGNYWRTILSEIHDSIVFIDEGEQFVTTVEFADVIKNSDNYYVIATRSSLFNLTYSVNEVYGIKNTSGNRYQGTRP